MQSSVSEYGGSTRTHGTSVGPKSGIALPSISGTTSTGYSKPRSYKKLLERHDAIKSTEQIWAELRDNVTQYIFPSEEQRVVPKAMARLVAYAKYGPAVADPVTGALRLRGSQRLLMPHEEAALYREEVRSVMVDIYMAKSGKAQGGKRAKALGNALTSSFSTAGPSSAATLSSVPTTPNMLGGSGGVGAIASRNPSITSAANSRPPTKDGALIASVGRGAAASSSNSNGGGGATKDASGKPKVGNFLLQTYGKSAGKPIQQQSTSTSEGGVGGGDLHTSTAGGTTTAGQSLNTSTATTTTDNATLPQHQQHRSTIVKGVAAANVKAMAVPDEVYGQEMLDQAHPMALQTLELTREELAQILQFCGASIPRCEKDGSKVKRSTIVDHFADVVFEERDRRVYALKRSDAKLDDVRTDELLTKRKETTIYNKTAPPAYTIDCYDKPHHVQRALHKRAFQVCNLADANNPQVAANVRCIRDEYRIAPGTVKEGWDGYCCIRSKRYGGGPVDKRPTNTTGEE